MRFLISNARYIFALSILAIAGCILALGNFYDAGTVRSRALHDDRAKLVALLAFYNGKPFHLDFPSRSADCRVHGPLPDHACTPGAVFSDVARERICTPGYAKSMRHVSTRLRRSIYESYTVAYPQSRGSYEVDHLIPLSLGGDNERANLFPQAAKPIPGFREKDLVEDYLHEEVCAGTISLAAAEEQIASDWTAVYMTLSPETIDRLKQKYTSWLH